MADKSTKEIADIMQLSPRTIETMRDKAKIKAGKKSVVATVAHFIAVGTLNPRIAEEGTLVS